MQPPCVSKLNLYKHWKSCLYEALTDWVFHAGLPLDWFIFITFDHAESHIQGGKEQLFVGVLCKIPWRRRYGKHSFSGHYQFRWWSLSIWMDNCQTYSCSNKSWYEVVFDRILTDEEGFKVISPLKTPLV